MEDTPVPHSFLPALQLCDFVHLEAKYTRAVPICVQRDRGRVHSLTESVRAFHELVARAPTAARVVYSRARARHDADGPARGVGGPALGRQESGVDEEEEVREGRAEVGAVDRAVARGLGRVDVLAAAAVELDGFLVRDVRQADGEEWLALTEHARASTEIGLFVLVQLSWQGSAFGGRSGKS